MPLVEPLSEDHNRVNKAAMENLGRVAAEQKRLIGFVASHAVGCRCMDPLRACAAPHRGLVCGGYRLRVKGAQP